MLRPEHSRFIVHEIVSTIDQVCSAMRAISKRRYGEDDDDDASREKEIVAGLLETLESTHFRDHSIHLVAEGLLTCVKRVDLLEGGGVALLEGSDEVDEVRRRLARTANDRRVKAREGRAPEHLRFPSLVV
jgi:hypothetical protein